MLKNPTTLIGKQGPEIDARNVKASDYTLEEWVEFAEYHLQSTIKIKRPPNLVKPIIEPELIKDFDELDSKYSIDSDVADVIDHVLKMQEEYEFSNDEDSIRDAIEESASLLKIQLNEMGITAACDRVLSDQ